MNLGRVDIHSRGADNTGNDGALLMQDIHHAAQAGKRNLQNSAGTKP